jgi:hypothetical protein
VIIVRFFFAERAIAKEGEADLKISYHRQFHPEEVLPIY